MGTTSCGLFAIACLLTQLHSLQTVQAFCSKYVEPEGYSCQERKIYTEDGYGILLHRVGALGRNRAPGPNSDSVSSKVKPSAKFPGSPSTGSPAPTKTPDSSFGQPDLSPMSLEDLFLSSSGAGSHGPGNQEFKRGEPVLLLHPEMLNGDSWFKHADPEGQTARLPFLLADEGFDVWVGHNRATYWTHDHTAVTYHEPEFWRWTWDQLAQYDIPTMLRYLRAETNQIVHVVGFSQSATVGAAAATRSDVAEMMHSLILIGPTIFRGRRNPLLMETWGDFLRDLMDGVPFPPSAWPGRFNFSREFNMQSIPLTGPGAEFRHLISGPDCCLSPSLSLFDNGWDGTTSSSNIEHAHQALMTPSWRKFDHGTPQLNFEAYGQPIPPDYEPRDIPIDLPMLVIHGGLDFFSPLEGIMEFIASMENRPSRVFLPSYAHFDLFLSESRKEDIYDPICAFLKSNHSP